MNARVHRTPLDYIKVIYSDSYLHLKQVTKLFIYCGPEGQRKCKSDQSRAPGDFSVKLWFMKYVTTYLQEIPQKIR